jgi:MFS family permease
VTTEAGSQTEEVNWPKPALAWYVNGVLMLAFVLAFIDRQIIALLVGPIQEDLNISDTEVSLLGGFAFVFFYTFLGIPIGRIVDRSNRKRLIAIGVFLWSCMTVACGFARNFFQLFVARVGVGVGEATLSPAALSILSDYFPPQRLGFAVSVYLSGAAIGTGLAFLLGGAALDFFAAFSLEGLPILGDLAAWQLAFVVVGAPGVFFTILILTIPEPARRSKLVAAASQDGRPGLPLREAIRFLLDRKKFYLHHFAGFGLYLAFTYGLSFWAIEYFVRTFGVERSDIAYIYGAQVVLLGGGGTLLAGYLSDYLERKGIKDAKLRVALWSMGPMVLLACSLPFIDSYALAIAAIMAMTFCWKFPLAPAAASLQIATPNEVRGLATGLYLFVGNTLGLAVGPAVIGVFSDYLVRDPTGLKWSIALAGVIMLPASVLNVFLCRKSFAPPDTSSAAPAYSQS